MNSILFAIGIIKNCHRNIEQKKKNSHKRITKKKMILLFKFLNVDRCDRDRVAVHLYDDYTTFLFFLYIFFLLILPYFFVGIILIHII